MGREHATEKQHSDASIGARPHQYPRERMLRTNNPLLAFIPRHEFSFAVGLHAHLARHHAIVAQHAIALERLIRSDSGLQVAVVKCKALGAGLLAGLYPAWRICSVQPAVQLKI